MKTKRVFVSYSWDSGAHRDWVKKLADSIESLEDFHVLWDGYDLDSLTDKNLFMEAGVHDADLVVVVATRIYKSKADTRAGGVGIETYLAAAAHWESLQNEGKTRVIVALREPDSTPNYLKGHLYIDFSIDADYQSSELKLIQLLRGNARFTRPAKRADSASDDRPYTFDRIEQLIKVGHSNRRALVTREQGTDFSGSNRIKYELWETRSPTLSYYLALADNINITQSIGHAAGRLKSLSLHPTDITVLRPRPPRAEQNLVASLLSENGFKTRVHEYTYKDYIWEFCIDEAHKALHPPNEVPNYTDQSVSHIDHDGSSAIAASARDLLIDSLQSTSPLSAHLVVAPGGMGKTSLCLAIAAKLHNRTDLRSSVVLIQAESIQRFVSERGAALNRINSIYQLYELHARSQDQDQTFDRNLFELGFLSGNLVVVIDGLDEFASLFPEAFSLEEFLTSLASFHGELGSSSVLLTTRNSQLIEPSLLESLRIKRYDLLGFDRASSGHYLSRRFRKYADGPALVARVQAQIDKVQLKDDEGRVVPFFADIAATVAEDGLADGTSEALEVAEDPTPYPSNNELTDHIVHSVLRREQVRHRLDLSEIDVVQLLSGLVADYSRRWPKEEMHARLTLLYDERAGSLASKLHLNPLLTQNRRDIELRYGFLSSYFEVLHVIAGITSTSLEREFIKCLARLSTDSNEFRDVKRYFSSRRDELIELARVLVGKLRKDAEAPPESKDRLDPETARRSIASLLNLCALVLNGSAQSTTEMVLQIYGVDPASDGSTTTLSGLYIRGDFPPMDFSNLVVVKGRFFGYRRFLLGRFSNSKFLYCGFDNCFDQSIYSSTLDPKSLDPSCDIGDLRDFLNLAQAQRQDGQKLVEAEAKKFLHSFFKNGRFIDNRKGLIRFSTKVPGLADNRLDRLISAGYICVGKEKEVATFFEISSSFQQSVRRLLTDNYSDALMRKFLAAIRG